MDYSKHTLEDLILLLRSMIEGSSTQNDIQWETDSLRYVDKLSDSYWENPRTIALFLMTIATNVVHAIAIGKMKNNVEIEDIVTELFGRCMSKHETKELCRAAWWIKNRDAAEEFKASMSKEQA